uniref:Uncharacterized protein n=1 Tax=Oryza barthii TaxID=65489 RepID=A0A0D3FVB6_9ORYZ
MATHRRTPPALRLVQRSEGMACVPLSFPPLLFFPLFSRPRRCETEGVHSIISTVCELELEMWCFPISCESFEPSGSQLLNRPRRIRLHRQALLLFRQADLPSLLSR